MSPRVCLEGFECILKKKKEIVLKIELQVDFLGPVQICQTFHELNLIHQINVTPPRSCYHDVFCKQLNQTVHFSPLKFSLAGSD